LGWRSYQTKKKEFHLFDKSKMAQVDAYKKRFKKEPESHQLEDRHGNVGIKMKHDGKAPKEGVDTVIEYYDEGATLCKLDGICLANPGTNGSLFS
jgi:hypothetical protein